MVSMDNVRVVVSRRLFGKIMRKCPQEHRHRAHFMLSPLALTFILVLFARTISIPRISEVSMFSIVINLHLYDGIQRAMRKGHYRNEQKHSDEEVDKRSL